MILVDPIRLADLIEDRLRTTEMGRGFDLRVERDLTRREQEWVYVGIAPHSAGIRAYEFAELLATLEQDIRKQVGKDEILLLPVRLEDVNGNGRG